MDVITAYLNGDLDEDVYMAIPENLKQYLQEIVVEESQNETVFEKARKALNDLRKGDKEKVCHLKKAIYGLRQAGRQCEKLFHGLNKISGPSSERLGIYEKRNGTYFRLCMTALVTRRESFSMIFLNCNNTSFGAEECFSECTFAARRQPNHNDHLKTQKNAVGKSWFKRKSMCPELVLSGHSETPTMRHHLFCISLIFDRRIITMLLTAMPRLNQSVTSSIDIFFSQNPAGVTIEFVKNKLLQEEARQIRDRVGNGKENGASEDLVFYSSSRNPSAIEQPKNRNKAKFRCYLCKQRGHFRTECPMLKRRGSTSGGPSNRNQFCGECDHNRRVPQQCHEDRKRFQDDGEIAFSINDAVSHHDHALQSGRNKIVFVIDSGCTQHLIGPEFEIYLDNVEDVNIELNVAKKQSKIRATKRGTLHVDSCGVNLKLKDVLMCQEVTYNLLSVSKAEEEGIDVVFSGGRVEFSKNCLTCLHGARIGNLFVEELFPRKNFVNACADVDLIHRRMGHSHVYAPSSVCEVCLKGKMTRSSFKSLEDEKKPKRVLEVISSDVAGPFTLATHDGYKYYLTFVDHYSRFGCVYLLEKKSDVYDKFVEYHAMVTAQHQVKISRFRSDGGGEYSSTKLNEFCKRNGIVQEFSVPRNPEQVGVCERLNRKLLNMSSCLIIESGLGKDMWGEAVRTANYLINRLSTRSTGGIPTEIWFGIRVFGCRAFSHIPKEDRQGKLSERCKSLVMIGYAANGYRLWNLEERVVTKARFVKFDESRMPAKLPNIIIPEVASIEEPEEPSTERAVEAQTPQDPGDSTNDQVIASENDDGTNLMLALMSGHLPSECPSTYEQAVNAGAGWIEAIEDEVKNLVDNETRTFVPAPENEKIIDLRWIFKVKKVGSESVKKARLVARGFQLDNTFEDIDAPVARMASLRTVLAMALERNLKPLTLDVKGAFLNGILKDAVYMRPPKGLKGYVCKLRKALYGLRQSPRCWNDCLDDYFVGQGELIEKGALRRLIRSRLDLIKPDLQRRMLERQLTNFSTKFRSFDEGDRVMYRSYAKNAEEWEPAVVKTRIGDLHYEVKSKGQIFRRHVNQLKTAPTEKKERLNTGTSNRSDVAPAGLLKLQSGKQRPMVRLLNRHWQHRSPQRDRLQYPNPNPSRPKEDTLFVIKGLRKFSVLMLSNEIGRKLFSSVISPALNSGMTLATFNFSGNLPLSKLRSMSNRKKTKTITTITELRATRIPPWRSTESVARPPTKSNNNNKNTTSLTYTSVPINSSL
ncbi:unnamed protein product [Nesidiocoris tenuis]|uniref:Endonuclease n=1 Tax=Nesidiocoris tenuis TaxID=355587 RepID=A0A6H5G2H8_9HEMI|nr:unnamed protein product [Nesidiocoris tenuis]